MEGLLSSGLLVQQNRDSHQLPLKYVVVHVFHPHALISLDVPAFSSSPRYLYFPISVRCCEKCQRYLAKQSIWANAVYSYSFGAPKAIARISLKW
jgi:hypothetical protein